MKEGLVSVITPCYNGSRYIKETIESVLSQTYADWEMIVVDDGSTDNSAAIIETYCVKDRRISLLRQPNGGSASARNNGIRKANGQYIALLDADDVWEKKFLQEQILLLNRKHTVCVYASYRRINEKSQEILKPLICRPSITRKNMLRMNYIGCLTGLYDCSRFGKIYLHEELKSVRDDYAYWFDIVTLAGIAYGNGKILARYRVFSCSTTGKKKKLIKAQFNFYHNYLHLGSMRSLYNTCCWGLAGILKFNRLNFEFL
jgi:teichuronic acid biosynthesis glycosyltransferase TuaG